MVGGGGGGGGGGWGGGVGGESGSVVSAPRKYAPCLVFESVTLQRNSLTPDA